MVLRTCRHQTQPYKTNGCSFRIYPRVVATACGLRWNHFVFDYFPPSLLYVTATSRRGPNATPPLKLHRLALRLRNSIICPNASETFLRHVNTFERNSTAQYCVQVLILQSLVRCGMRELHPIPSKANHFGSLCHVPSMVLDEAWPRNGFCSCVN